MDLIIDFFKKITYISLHGGISMNSEIYCSVDVEADGNIPGVSNMLSFASVAYN